MTNNIIMKIDESSLLVVESELQDDGRGHVRIDTFAMEEMNLHDGDQIEIIGESITKIYTCLELLPGDVNKGIIRLDADSRNALGVKIGEKIRIRRVVEAQNTNDNKLSKESRHYGTATKSNEPAILISGSCIDFEKKRAEILEYLNGLERGIHVKDKCKCYSDGKKTLGWDFFIISIPLQVVERLDEIHPEIGKHEGATLEQRFVHWLSDRMRKSRMDYHLKIAEIPFESVTGFRLDPSKYRDNEEMDNLK